MQKHAETSKDGTESPKGLFLEPCNNSQTAPDGNIEDFTVGVWDFASAIISIILRIASILFNILVAYEYYRNDKINYFIWTICCIVIPMIVTTLMCINMYLQDMEASKRKKSVFEILLFVVVIPFLFRYCQSLSFAVACKRAERKKDIVNQKKFFEFLIQEESDVALIRIFECFLEAAPQKLLQISIILAGEDEMTWKQSAVIISCLISLTWCMVVYHKYNRYSQPDKQNISLYGIIMQFCWHFFITVSRISSIAIVASVFPLWTLLACSIHSMIMCIVLFCFDRPVNFCSKTIFHSFAFALVLGLVYIFNYITPREGRTRIKFTLYYIVCFLENIICVILFIMFSSDRMHENAFFIPLCAFSVLSFICGIVFMVLYYTQCHPNIVAQRTLIKKRSKNDLESYVYGN